ncbi:MAG: hypothetical protein H7123_09090, partial [Thermoleophilia bacterium]|nr:hypothetical protein [Thermoleophilia bacterium]
MGLFDSITHAVSTAVSSVVHTAETVEHKAPDVVHDSVSSVEHAAVAVVHVASEAA